MPRLTWSGRPAASYVKARVSAAVAEPSRYEATEVRAPSPSQVVAVRLGRVKHQAKVYTLDGPGSYTVQLLYQFKHPRDPGLPPVPSDVVRRPVRSNVASFDVN